MPGCVLKLKSQLEKFISSSEETGRVLEFEHGILDIIEAGALVWLQSGHSERAIAVYQALLEFNLFRWVVMTVRVRVIYITWFSLQPRL